MSAVLPCQAQAHAGALTVDEVRAGLRAEPARATWIAKEAPLSTTQRQVAIAAAVVDETPSLRTVLAADAATAQQQLATSTSEPLPARFDWRDRSGRSFMPPESAQGACGSCIAFAAASTLEAQLNIGCDDSTHPFALSRQYLHSCGGAHCQGGGKLSEVVAFLVANGVPDNGCLPYSGKDVACSEACTDAPDRAVRDIGVTQPTTGVVDVDAIKRALMRGPVLSSMILFEDLEFYGSGVYQHVRGVQLGSHAIALVGWSDADAAWIARNSWGETWGDKGYFLVAWNDASLPGRYTWSFDVTGPVGGGLCSKAR